MSTSNLNKGTIKIERMDSKQDYRGLCAVIWGADNYNTLGLLRSLAVVDLNITLIVTGSKHGVATASKYCKKYYKTS